jgi:predicted Zn-dependent peptidase
MKDVFIWHRRVLANGLVVLLYPRASALTTQLSVAIKYGSNKDSDSSAGKAHFLEHMIVGGSKKRIKNHHQIEKLGGCSGFETSAECTFTTIDIFPEKISEGSKIMSELIFNREFESDKFELERKVILNEISQTEDNPHDKIAETLIKCLFKKHPIRNPVLGTRKTVKHLTLEELKQVHQDYYTPKNMIVLLTGKFSNTDVDNVITDFQDGISQSTLPETKRIVEKTPPKKQVTITRSGIIQTYICFGFRTPPAIDKDAKTLDLINAILGMGESSRLFVELREKRALTYDFNSMNISGLDYGFFSIACAIKPIYRIRTEEIIKKELRKIKTKSVSDGELQKSKNIITGDIMRAIDNPHELPRIIADTEIIYANPIALSNYLSQINSITSDDILVAAEKFFQERNYSTAILIPKMLSQRS